MKRNTLLTSLLCALISLNAYAKDITEDTTISTANTNSEALNFKGDDLIVTLNANWNTWTIRGTDAVTTLATVVVNSGYTLFENCGNIFGDTSTTKSTGDFLVTGDGTYDAVTKLGTQFSGSNNITITAPTIRFDIANAIFAKLNMYANTKVKFESGNVSMETLTLQNSAKLTSSATSFTVNGAITLAENAEMEVSSGTASAASLSLKSGAEFTSTADTFNINGAITVNSANVNISNLTAKDAEGNVVGMGELTVTGNSTVDITTQLYQRRSKITTSGTSQVTVTALEKSGETSGSVMQVNDSSTLNLNVSQNLTWDTKVSVANGATFNLTNTKAKNIIDANLKDGATASLSTSSEGGFFYVSRWADTNWGEGGTDKTSISFNKSINIFSSSATDLYTVSVGSNTELKVGGDIILTRGTLVLNGSNQIKNISNEAQAQGDFLVLKFAGEKSGTLSLGADNAVKSIGFTTSEGGITPGTGLIELNGYEFTFNEFIEDENGKISFVDFDEKLVKFTGDEDSLTKNEDGSLMYIFAGADADQKLYLGNDGYLSLSATAVPEPAELAMIFGAIALGFAIYRKRKNA